MEKYFRSPSDNIRWLTRLFIFMSLGSALLLGESVEGVGYGLTKDAAIEQAKRDAVEVGLGAYISSETVVTATTLTDNIYSKAQGFVKTFKVVNESQGPDGNWEVTISAEVTAILDEVMQDEAALQTLLNSMNRPRVIFLVREENLIDNTPTDFAETKLLSQFYDKGFDVIDRQLVQALKGKPDYEDALAGNVSAAAKVAGQLGADIIVIGTAKISSGGKFYNMTSGQADINGKIVRVDTGDILAVVPNAHGKKPHISPSTAGVNAMNEAAGKLGTEIIRQLIEKWSTQQSNFIKAFIVLKNADFMSYTMFESFLKAQTVSGVRNAYAKSLNDGVAEYEVEFEGKSMDLAMGLSKTSPDGLNFKVTGITGNRITAEVVP
ncbi:MAG TPA: hypothetical protein EYO07_00150 [Candidatus Marinimicrobia bacterium]|nr:hypothetical protein [Candidatus Neomarinimicrobiota bacterium]